MIPLGGRRCCLRDLQGRLGHQPVMEWPPPRQHSMTTLACYTVAPHGSAASGERNRHPPRGPPRPARDHAMPVTDLDSLLGRHARLPIRRFAAAGAFLAVDPDDPAPDADTLLLPAAEVPASARVGDVIDVFVHLDSEERPIATTRTPKLALGEVAFLTVTALTEIGAFVDWGLGKELLVPFAEQSKELFVGERQPIGLYLDRSRRLAGTMYVTDL